jgi:hypothetical protein
VTGQLERVVTGHQNAVRALSDFSIQDGSCPHPLMAR